MSKNDQLSSRGPWSFETTKALSQNESEKFDFKHIKYNKRKRYFRPFLPLDSLQISNLSGSSKINVTINNVYDVFVLPNSVESFSESGITEITVTNVDGTEISAGNVILEVSKDGYDADERAKEQKAQGPLKAIVENATGISL